jgi:hypothetical protein
MLHPAKIPDCAPEMECLLDFQERLLEFACSNSNYDKTALVTAFGQEIADWLGGNNIRQRLLDRLKEIIRDGTEEEKKELLEKFKHDRAYTEFVDDPAFRFVLDVNEHSSDFLKNAKRFLVGHYDQLKDSGFHPLICGHGDIGFNDKHWWQGYRSANPGLHTCSICDASLAAAGETIEHYFPKGQYPALSTHPANLLPICKTCNSDIKKEKDPLGADPITTIFLPYRHFVRQNARLSFQDDGQGGYKVDIVPADEDPTNQKRVENFERLFEVSKRWSKALGEITETAESRARAYIEVMREFGRPINAETIPGYIEAACSQMERNWGVGNYEYIATEWLRWAKDKKSSLVSALMA